MFRAAGHYFAERAYVSIPQTTRRVVRALPRLIARPVALRQVRRVARRYFAGTVGRTGASLVLEVPSPVASSTGAVSAGCAFYETGLRELLRLLVGTEGVVEHVRCAALGEGRCQWRVEWWKA